MDCFVTNTLHFVIRNSSEGTGNREQGTGNREQGTGKTHGF
jgi:hypothetical protein